MPEDGGAAARPVVRRTRVTAASVVSRKIRADILSGVLTPGERLKVDALCARYEATINPTREALNRLVSEGLVEVADQRGFSVTPVSLSHWRDLVHTRCLAEGTALREAITQRTEQWEDEIVLSLHRLKKTPRFLPGNSKAANPEWEPVHRRFHDALIATCGAELLLKFCHDLGDMASRYRHIAAIAPSARTTYNDEHQDIANACLEGDIDGAVSQLTEHYRVTLGVVEEYLRALDEEPEDGRT
ncbi:GntR family transcriptional regulator [Palleronia sp. LCG004]|uniref:GntR family transcriptional regulator n=1 Tax=Palleronia sp. LCG004 TaxID=3079304 RepID=UPI002943A73B|nr:GntR family transcriptional regulator [Palleronia sp. LCG004]WOI57915.1 GntR family transcriptional regulator [Palleronia sp. LCG004]